MSKSTSGRPSDDPGQTVARARPTKGIGRVERLTTAFKKLEHDRKIRKSELLELAGVGSQSSFKRLKVEFQRAGLPLTYSAADGYYHIPPDASIARYGIDTRTRAQLAQVRAAVTALGGVARDALEDVLEVLEARIALDDAADVPVVTSRHPQPRGGASFYNALDRALSGVRECRWLSFDYEPTSGGERAFRTIAPYAVHAHDGRYYVWGTLEGDTSTFPTPRLFALDRMNDVSLESDTFERDASLSLDDALRHSFGTMVSADTAKDVVVTIAPEAAAFVACRSWPAETSMDNVPDGGLRMTFRVSKLDEIVAWVLSFGGMATIESPLEARRTLMDKAKKITANQPIPESTS